MDIGESTLAGLLPGNSDSTAMDWHYLKKLPRLLPDDFEGRVEFLDLGAGDGRSKREAERAMGADRINWRGVDIGDSTEHLARPADAPSVDVYDGVKLPYDAERFDVVWCKQTLEHVRHPDAVISEVSRVLRPGGLFIGSVSQLEPYHSRSIFNWTHYGIRVVFKDHGLEVFELTPGVDGLLLMLRSVFGYQTGLNAFFSKETPFNQVLTALFTSAQEKPDSDRVTRSKLKIAGHIHFASRKSA